jgi:dihydroneopterin aldolase
MNPSARVFEPSNFEPSNFKPSNFEPSNFELGDRILVRDLRLWAHVGVLEHEREHGQWFRLDFAIAADLSATASRDDLSAGFDYGLAIVALQRLARSLRCLTLEHFSDQLLDRLEHLYGPVGLWLEVAKCRVPVAGFTGSVAVRRQRRWA